MGGRSTGWRERLYRRLLIVHPAGFRRMYESEMVETFGDAWRDRAEGRGMLSGARFWFWLVSRELRAGVVSRRAARAGAGRQGRRGWTAGLRGDLRAALRQFRSTPRVSVGTAILLGVGLATATWSWGIEYGAFGRGLPVSEPDRMMALRMVDEETREVTSGFSVEDLEVVESGVPGGEGAAGLWLQYRTDLVVDGVSAEEIRILEVTPSMFRLLELSPLRGRLLQDGDADPVSPAVAVLNHRFWERRLRADPGVIGRTLPIGGQPVVVVGVLPATGRFEVEDVWLAAGRADRTSRRYAMVLRRPADMTPAGLAVTLSGLGSRLPAGPSGIRRAAELQAVDFAESFRFEGGPGAVYLRVTTRAGALLLIMALANVANLFLVRARVRVRELTVRYALGASRLQIVRKLALETALPVLLATVVGGVLASAGLDWQQRASEQYAGGLPPVWQVFRLELPHLVVLAAGALVSMVVVSLVAGITAVRRDSGGSLRSARGSTATRFHFGRCLVAVEITAAMALFLLASLMLRSAWNLRAVDWGFARDSVMTGHVSLDEARYPLPEDRLLFWTALQSDIEGAPGVVSASLATQLPMIRYAPVWQHRRPIEVEGSEFADVDVQPLRYVDAVTPTFFETFERPVLAGRAFGPGDNAASTPVAIVNDAFTRAYFPRDNAIGRRIRLWSNDQPGPWRTIVGVAPHLWMDTDVNAEPEGVYVPFAQMAPPEASIAMRVTGPPADRAGVLVDAIGRLDPALPVTDLMTMSQLIRLRTRFYRANGPPLIWIGLASLMIAVAGLYAVVSYMSSLRTREFGIRSALGSDRLDLVRRSLVSEVPPVLGGSAAGMAIGLWLTDGFSRFLFQVDPWSPSVAAVSLAILLLATLLASLVPVLRASRIDLVRVLGPD
jgi:putative ABC transport system permease protein